jgi:hypothetical protein
MKNLKFKKCELLYEDTLCPGAFVKTAQAVQEPFNCTVGTLVAKIKLF